MTHPLDTASKTRAGPPVPARRIPSFAALWELWAEDYRTHRCRAAESGFHVIAVHRFGVWVREHDSRAVRKLLGPVYSLLNILIETRYGVELRSSVEVGRRVRFDHASAGITVHLHARIGDDCIFRQRVTLGVRGDEPAGSPAPHIQDRVVFGAGAVVVGPVTVGHDSLIGPNVVVRRDVPPFSRVAPPEPEIRPRRPTGPAGDEAAPAADRTARAPY